MRLESVYIAGLGTFLPPAVEVRTAIAQGWYDPLEAAETGLESVLVGGSPPPEMAVAAARQALAASGIDPTSIGLVLHASVCFQGLEFYPMASYIQKNAVGSHSALALEVRALSNGGMASLELAASYLSAAPDRSAALVTTADRFHESWLDRWRSDTGMVMADGAAALVLSRRGGILRVLSVASTSDPTLEGLHRGAAPFTSVPEPIDVHRRKREYIAEVGLPDMLRRFRAGLRGAVTQALRDSGTELSAIRRFVLPNIGRNLIEREYLEALEIEESKTTWSFGKRIGHLGAGDQFAGLAQLWESGSLRPNDRCMLLGVGAGFTWTCAVLEVSERGALQSFVNSKEPS